MTLPESTPLESELRVLVLHGMGATRLEGRPDSWVSEQFPHLAALTGQRDGEGALASMVLALVGDAISRIEPPARAALATDYFGMPRTPKRPHKTRQREASVAFGELERGAPWSQSTFRQHIAPRLRTQVAELLAEAAATYGPAPARATRSARVAVDWPLHGRQPRAQDEIVVLAATPTMRDGPRSALVATVRELEPYILRARPHVYALEGSHNALVRNGLLRGYPKLQRLPAGVEGGLVYATETILAAKAAGHRSAVIYLMDPRDPSSRYPASLALKRACVLEQTPFLSSASAALQWFRLEWAMRVLSGTNAAPEMLEHLLLTPKEADIVLSADAAPRHDGIALAAHDRHKVALLKFATRYQYFLTRWFATRYATEVSGRLLNGEDIGPEIEDRWQPYGASHGARDDDLEEARRWQQNQMRLPGPAGKGGWVSLLAHGRKGGLTQLARRIIEVECTTVVFFQDASAPREHDTELQVLDRAAQLPKSDCLLLYDAESAYRWARGQERCREPGAAASATTLVEAYKRIFGVDLVLASPVGRGRRRARAPWEEIVNCASRYFLEALVSAVHNRSRLQPVRVGLSWGGATRDVVEGLGGPDRLGALGVRAQVELARGDEHALANIPSADERPRGTVSRLAATGGLIGPQDLRVIPLVGVMGSQSPEIEAHSLVDRVASLVGGQPVTYTEYAFERTEAPAREFRDIDDDWRQLDIALCSCDEVREDLRLDVVGFPADLHAVLKSAHAEVGHIYLRRGTDGVTLADYGAYRSTGIPFEVLQDRARSDPGAEVILVAGAEQERVLPAWAAIRAGLVSTFITDARFAWNVLCREFPRRLRPTA